MWCVADLVPCTQFKKLEKHPWRSVTFRHSSMGVFHIFKIVRIVPNRAKRSLLKVCIVVCDSLCTFLVNSIYVEMLIYLLLKTSVTLCLCEVRIHFMGGSLFHLCLYPNKKNIWTWAICDFIFFVYQEGK